MCIRMCVRVSLHTHSWATMGGLAVQLASQPVWAPRNWGRPTKEHGTRSQSESIDWLQVLVSQPAEALWDLVPCSMVGRPQLRGGGDEPAGLVS